MVVVSKIGIRKYSFYVYLHQYFNASEFLDIDVVFVDSFDMHLNRNLLLDIFLLSRLKSRFLCYMHFHILAFASLQLHEYCVNH